MSGRLSSIIGQVNGKTVREYRLDNGTISCSVLDYGCILRTLNVPDKNGKKVDVVLGYNDIEHYAQLSGRMGAVIGRYANRIRGGIFSIDDVKYQLSRNRGSNHIHGGFSGFDKKIWDVVEHDRSHILFSYKSVDGEEGYPGEIDVMVEYQITEKVLSVCYTALSDKNTICNLTNHSYFNLSGIGKIDDQRVQICSTYYVPTDQEGIPTEGLKLLPDEMDMNESKKIGDTVFDIDFILDSKVDSAVCCSELSGITMRISTDMPALRFYTGDGLKETDGKNGKIGPRSGMCFETQFPVDSPNSAMFSDCVLRRGQRYHHKTIFTFE